ncbi:MAG: hypothetical protein LBE55_00930 [Clostridiales bacterium]|jgi:hypothetical protein|nr:hypothetical protein [Clostridiales bacterium]
MHRPELFVDMARFVGKTVTIFTTSGGISGSGFTGVLAYADERIVKLITRIGAAPACPLGSTCTGNFGTGFGFDEGFGFGGGFGGGCCRRRCCGGFGGFGASFFLGSVTEIPICNIVSFTHNAI